MNMVTMNPNFRDTNKSPMMYLVSWWLKLSLESLYWNVTMEWELMEKTEFSLKHFSDVITWNHKQDFSVFNANR